MHTSTVGLFLTVFAASCSVIDGYANAGESHYQLAGIRRSGDLFQVKVSLTVKGHLKVKAASSNVVNLPLSVVGNLSYDERWVSSTGNRTLRYYHDAAARIRVSERDSAPFLRQNRRLIAHQGNELYSPWGSLTRQELDIVEVHADTALLGALLPKNAVKTGDAWTPEAEIMPALLRLDAIRDLDVKCKLMSVSDNDAQVKVQGKVDGAVGGVSSSVTINGQFKYDLKAQSIKKLSLEIREQRSISHEAPGLDVTAQLDAVIAPLFESSELSDAAVDRAANKDFPENRHLAFRSRLGGFELVHDRQWHLMADLNDVTILRRVDRGNLVAQCNISRLDARGDKPLSLEDFQANVQRVLGDHLKQPKEAQESTTNTGLRILRLSAEGTVSELPVQWIYYHVENEQGECVSLVFTMEASLVEQFADSGRVMAASLQIDEAARPDRPTLAEPRGN